MKKKFKKENNFAFIDGQNLYMQTDWDIDFKKFRVYLKDKFNINEAYYFLGFKKEESNLYVGLQKAGFILMFNDRSENLESEKKGNVDTNLVFEVMKNLIEEDSSKVMIVSGDGDYKKMIDYLIEKERFKNLLTPTNNVSSLYHQLEGKYFTRINKIRDKVEYKMKKPR